MKLAVSFSLKSYLETLTQVFWQSFVWAWKEWRNEGLEDIIMCVLEPPMPTVEKENLISPTVYPKFSYQWGEIGAKTEWEGLRIVPVGWGSNDGVGVRWLKQEGKNLEGKDANHPIDLAFTIRSLRLLGTRNHFKKIFPVKTMSFIYIRGNMADSIYAPGLLLQLDEKMPGMSAYKYCQEAWAELVTSKCVSHKVCFLGACPL